MCMRACYFILMRKSGETNPLLNMVNSIRFYVLSTTELNTSRYWFIVEFPVVYIPVIICARNILLIPCLSFVEKDSSIDFEISVV